MKRKSTKADRDLRKLSEAGIKIAALGGLFVLLPVVLGSSPFGKTFSALSPVGWVLLLTGIAFIAISHQLQKRRSPALPPIATPTRDPQVEPARQAPARPRPQASDILVPDVAQPPAVAPPTRPETWSKAVFDVIEWRRFEAVVERLFQQAGFETTSQSHGADDGVDVWLYSKHQPGEPVSLVQCKHWHGKRVGVDKIRELRGVMASRNIRRGQFATTSTFTPDAEAFATHNGIHLLDAQALLALIAKRTPEQQAELLAVALEGDYSRPTCVNCGTKLVERRKRQGGAAFWGCPTYPRCRTTLPMRAS